MSYRVCEACGVAFHQFGRGRPAKYCVDHRGRYGSSHRRYRAQTIASAAGQSCYRCGKVLGPDDAVDLDHVDGAGPGDYGGLSCRSCNRSSAAARGNAMRAAAYRAMKAGHLAGGKLLSPNGAPPAAPLEPRLDVKHQCHLGVC